MRENGVLQIRRGQAARSEKTGVLRIKTDVKAGFCRYIFYTGDIPAYQECMQKYHRW